MSLLMDALRKAEEAKRQSEASGKAEPHESPPPPENLDTPAEPPGMSGGLPELPSRLELLDAEFHPQPETKAPQTPPAPASAQQQSERAAVRNVFQAKQPPPRRLFPYVIGLATIVAVAGIGGYFWWQMQPVGGLSVSRAVLPAGTGVPALPPQPPPADTLRPAAVAAAPESEKEAEPAAQAPVGAPATSAARPAEPLPSVATRPAAQSAPIPIRIASARLQINPRIAAAYQAFQSGNLASAEDNYQSVLKADAKNTDALHGLAAIRLRQGDPESAEGMYLRILEADPKDSAALAGLVGLKGQADPLQSESRLKNLLASQPDAHQLNFALGNLYARQGRWNEAQQAYFRAYTGDSEHPDYQFNLAVSLEQLRQPRLALQYYQGALAAAAQRSAAFDPGQAASRVRELQQ